MSQEAIDYLPTTLPVHSPPTSPVAKTEEREENLLEIRHRMQAVPTRLSVHQKRKALSDRQQFHRKIKHMRGAASLLVQYMEYVSSPAYDVDAKRCHVLESWKRIVVAARIINEQESSQTEYEKMSTTISEDVNRPSRVAMANALQARGMAYNKAWRQAFLKYPKPE